MSRPRPDQGCRGRLTTDAVDEVVVGDWLHAERMDDRTWHVVLAGHHLSVQVAPRTITVQPIDPVGERWEVRRA